jgi:hypothetical protein
MTLHPLARHLAAGAAFCALATAAQAAGDRGAVQGDRPLQSEDRGMGGVSAA